MGKESAIEYCDSTANPEMGCNGCELWAPSKEMYSCYAGALTDFLRAGHKGYPKKFGEPVLFPERIDQACKWKDLSGTARPQGKSHLNGMPRVIFLDDMGDTWTEDLELMWLEPYVPMMEAAPHIWLFLTKRPWRMLKFFRQLGRVPRNFWLGCSIIERKAMTARLLAMQKIREQFPETILWVSWEPAYEPINWTPATMGLFNWFVFGGESEAVRLSGIDIRPARPSHPAWFKDAVHLAGELGLARFFKQWGAWVPCSELSDAETDALYKPTPARYPEAMRKCLVDQTVLQLDGTQGNDYSHGAMLMFKVGKKKAGARLGGAELREMPRLAA